ncbi:MAG: S46 family peptidase [Bacteroidales bacterium]|nr:S46 family peptidase [Bacteroidales bacterium]
MKKLGLLLGLLLSLTMLKADEGMWLMMLLNKNISQMQEMGLQLTAEDIYNVNHSSMKDGVVVFGPGCTGEMISKDGLLLTNHHCGYANIQALSSEENNYLEDGFWAKTREEELPCEGLSVHFFISMEDVSETVLDGIHDKLSETDRNTIIKRRVDKLIETHSENGKYKVRVVDMFDGNAYYIFIYQEFPDVRFVGSPPTSLGKYGGDADNWTWPRHTADFSLFRVYADKNGNPAHYSEDNVPYQPKFYFPISLAGNEEGDFAMIIGFPGRTDRYANSYEIEMKMKEVNPVIIGGRGRKLDVITAARQKNSKTNIQYADKAAKVSNYWKYTIGQTEQIVNNRVIERKKEVEDQFVQWANASPDREIYRNVIGEYAEIYKELSKTAKGKELYDEVIFSSTDLFDIWKPFYELDTLLQKKYCQPGTRNYQRLIIYFKKKLKDYDTFFKDYDAAVDQEIMSTLLAYFYEESTPEQRPDLFNKLAKKYKGNFKKLTADLYKKSILHDQDALYKFLEKPNVKTLQNDRLHQLLKAFYEHFFANMSDEDEIRDRLDKNDRLFMRGLMEMNPDKLFYPNANSMIRLTYGQVKGYKMRDALMAKHYTTLEGTIAKYEPGSWEFDLPEKLIDLFNAKDYGPYTDKEGRIRACFLTNNDITGGNSGSPVINGKGELIGCAFDGNWEAMSSDLFFETHVQRTIAVDIRYILFVIDKIGDAQHLIDEMKIVK